MIVGNLQQVKTGMSNIYWALHSPSGKSLVYRKYFASNGRHIYTLNPREGISKGLIAEGPRFKVLNFPLNDTDKLFRCVQDGKHFISKEPRCEGAVNVGIFGYVYNKSLPNSKPLFRYYNSKIGDYLIVIDKTFIPQDYREQLILGYVPVGQEEGLFSAYADPTAPPPGQTNIYRKFRSSTGEHFFTAWSDEATDGGFVLQDIGFRVYSNADTNRSPIFRCNKVTHFISKSETCEKDISSCGLDEYGKPKCSESIYGYVNNDPTPGTSPLFRFFKPATDDYLETLDIDEGNKLGYEGDPLILGYVPSKAEFGVYSGIFSNIETMEQALPADQRFVYRSFNKATKKNSYSLSPTEGALNGNIFGKAEYKVYASKGATMIPIYRCFDSEQKAQFSSTQANCEIPSCVNNSGTQKCNRGLFGYIYPNVESVRPKKTVKLYRLYNPTLGDYIETTAPKKPLLKGYVQQVVLGLSPK